MAEVGIVFVTVDSQENALEIARALVGDRWAACVNLFPIHSVYRWNKGLQEDSEWQLVIKTNLDRFEALAAYIQTLHPYDLPEIVALPIVQGSPAYLQWVTQETSP